MLNKIADAVKDYEIDAIETYVNAALASGISAKEILDEGLVKGMDDIGKRFSAGEVFVPEVLMAANTMQAGMDLIRDELVASGSNQSKGRVIIGTVKGDLHDIGKKLVGMMFEGAGYEVIDLGVDIPAADFVETAKSMDADFVGMSAMLTTTMTEMKQVTDMLKAEGVRAVPLVGGAPLTGEFAASIGACYSHDAASAVELIKGL